jgi:hypothetical protein
VVNDVTDKKYKIISSASDARKIMKLGRCFPVDIKRNNNPRESDKPSVFVFENLDGKESKIVFSPAKARSLLKESYKMIDIKENARPKENDAPTVFVFEINEEFLEDFKKTYNNENLGGK